MKHIYDNQNGNQNGNNKSAEERFTERFRELASSYEPTFEPADWSAMQSKLAVHNEKDRRRVIFRRLATFATMGAAAMILLFGGYQFLDTSSNKISNQNIAFQETTSKSNSESTKLTTIEKTNTQISIQNNLTENLESTVITKTKSNFDLKNKNQNNQIAQSISFSTTKKRNSNNTPLASVVSSENLNDEVNKAETNSENSYQNSTQTNEATLLVGSETEIARLDLKQLENINSDLFANVKPKEIKLPKLEIDEVILTNPNEELIRTNPVVSAVGKWRIGSALMAMANVYKSNNKQRINYANGYGIMADYQIAKRFTISAGAIYTQKRIDIEEPLSIPTISNGFNPTDEAWVKKNKTQINWQLLDLPIHLRYNAIQNERNKWFVSAGTSNYFFLKENYESDYTVSYQDIYDPRLTRTQDVVSQRETQSALQLFATINVSVGLETSLGKHLTLQVEPYWRFPVRSLGSEGVFVQTGGLLTRINFAL